MKTEKVNFVQVSEWNNLVEKTYNRPYSFQQQCGCQPRGIYTIEIPIQDVKDFDLQKDSIEESVNSEEMGVSFAAWLSRDPNQKLSNPEEQQDYYLHLWWKRNFYPQIEVVADDLYKNGLLAAGEYVINIDW